MSIRAMNWAMEQATGCPWTQCLLYVVADCANPEGICWPSADWMADKSQQSRATVYRRLAEMRDMGLLELFQRFIDGDGKVFYEGAVGRRQTSPEIRLIFAAKVDLPRKRTRRNTEESDDQDDGGVSLQATGGVSHCSDTPVAAQRQGPSHCSDSKKNLNLNRDDQGGVARAATLSDQCFELAREIGKLCGYPEPIDWPPKWSQSHYRVQTWLTAGWSRENIIAAVTETMAGKRDGPPSSINYFDKPIAQFIERRNAPLPQVVQRSQEIIDAKAPAAQPGSSWQQSKDNWRASANEFKRRVAEADAAADGSSSSGGAVVRLDGAAGLR